MKRIMALALLVTGLCHASDFSGAWKADYVSPDGHQRQTKFLFHVKDGTLTGTVVETDEELAIQKGKVQGNQISFIVVHSFEGEQLTIRFTGGFAGDVLKIKIDYGDRAFEIAAKREIR